MSAQDCKQGLTPASKTLPASGAGRPDVHRRGASVPPWQGWQSQLMPKPTTSRMACGVSGQAALIAEAARSTVSCLSERPCSCGAHPSWATRRDTQPCRTLAAPAWAHDEADAVKANSFLAPSAGKQACMAPVMGCAYRRGVVSPTGFEPVTPRLGIWCSILLSYEDETEDAYLYHIAFVGKRQKNISAAQYDLRNKSRRSVC